MTVLLDCSGLACPEPVLRARRYLAEHGNPPALTVVLDNPASCENVSRFLTSQGYTVCEDEANGVWTLSAHAGDSTVPVAPPASQKAAPPVSRDAANGKTLVFIASSVMGSGDDALGARLMQNFLSTLPEMGDTLWRLVFVNSGVLLSTRNSPALEQLQTLEKQGVGIFVCGTCLEHFGVLAEKAVGETTNMLDIITGMQLADKVIRI